MSEGIRFKKIDRSLKSILMLVSCYTLLSGCVGITEVDPANTARAVNNVYAGTNQALIFPDNPVALTGKNVTSANFEGHLIAQFITANNHLETKCHFKQYSPDIFNPGTQVYFTDTSNDECLVALNDTNSSTQVLQSSDESWVYPTESDEFYQVNTFYHVKTIIDRYLDSLSFAHRYVHLQGGMTLPPATKYNFADTQSYWLSKEGKTSTLKVYSKCIIQDNAYFSPSQDILCFGYDDNSSFKMVQDPSVIYHEVGHAIVKAMMNQRNVTSGVDPQNSNPYFEAHPFQSDLGELFYDEAGSINEGIADWFSYYMNQRTKVAEFAFHKIQGSYRPIDEDETAHSADVSTATGERLSYPKFLHYNPVDSKTNYEDNHFAGGIVSHYLVALTKQLKTSCSFTDTSTDAIHKESTDYVMLLLNETLAEVGDLTAKGSDLFSQYATSDNALKNVFFTNLNSDESYLWTQVVNPPNFRRFFRIFGKNILHYISTGLCPQFSLDNSEQLLDEYGLLLFKSYEDKGNGLDSNLLTYQTYGVHTGKNVYSNRLLIPFSLNTTVNEANRRNTILVSKEFINLDDENIAYIIDGQTDIKNILANLTFEGENVTTTENIAGPEYNNNNVKISPGEVVALSLNLFNSSNSAMGGVQVLANDWDHMKLNDNSHLYTNRTSNKNGLNSNDIAGGISSYAPCSINGFPTESEGGLTDTSTTTAGNCSHISKTNASIDSSEVVTSITYPKNELDAPQPICLVQYSDESETRWVSQNFYRQTKLGLEDSDCLNNPSMSGNNFNPNECLMRVLPGAAQAVLGKIDPQSTWVDTITTDETPEFNFDAGHITLMEVNKWITPGTKFNCRYRVRFTNCKDCFGENESALGDYSDFEYAGSAPFKVINLQFTVLD